LNRNIFVASALAAASTAPLGAQTPAPLTLHVSGTGADDVAPMLYAQKAGLYRANGFETTFERANSGAATVAAIVGGAVDIGKSSMGSLIAARAHNVDLRILAGGALFRNSNARSEVLLVVAPDSPIRSGKDFNGKTVSVPSLGDQNSMAIRAWVDAHGGDSRTLSLVEVPSSAAVAAVDQGRIAGAVVVPPFAAKAIAEGKAKMIAAVFGAIGTRFLETAYFTTGDYAVKHRDLVLRFGKLTADAAGYVNGHLPETADMLSTFSGVPAATIADAGVSFFATSVEPRDIQPLIDAMAKYGLIDHRFDAAEFVFK
jgi:NitT/TauT family transport system substrate-binding protein